MKIWNNVIGETFELNDIPIEETDLNILYYYTLNLSYFNPKWCLERVAINQGVYRLGSLEELKAIYNTRTYISLESSRTKKNASLILAIFLAENPIYLKYL